MATIKDFLKGVQVNRYRQALGVEHYPTYIVDGVPMGWRSVLRVGSFTEHVFTFDGVPAALVPGSGTVQGVKDASGNLYDVSFDCSVDVSGTELFERSSNRVVKENISPRLWRVTVMHREGELV